MPKSAVQLARGVIARWNMARDPVGAARARGVHIGSDCRVLGMTGETFGSEPFLVRIGNHVTITAGVRFVTHDGGVWVFRADLPDIDVFNPIRVGNNVFIGIGSILLPGTHIGDNCIIGAGSIVTGVIPSNAVAAGVPARVIKTVDQYWESVVPRAMHIRSLSPEHKRSILLRQFGIARSEEAAAPNKEAQPALR